MFKKMKSKKYENLPDTFIGEKCTLTGSIHLEAPCIINGNITGDSNTITSCDEITFGFQANVTVKTIECTKITIEGTITANIIAEIIILKSNAIVNGDVTGKCISIEDGALITGCIDINTEFEMPSHEDLLPVYTKKENTVVGVTFSAV